MREFRQHYIGPVIGSYGNMFRIRDCPMDSATNRLSIAELRLTTYKAAVHSDMVFWDQEDSDESVAVSLYSTLFGVPQISMRLQTISPSHRQVLASFLAFRNLHIDTLMKGEFLLREIDSNYGKIQACSGSERITLLSSAPLMELGDYADEYVINLTEQTQLIVTGQTEGVCYEIFDCRGACISRAKKLEKNEYVIPLPTAARIHFIRQKCPV